GGHTFAHVVQPVACLGGQGGVEAFAAFLGDTHRVPVARGDVDDEARCTAVFDGIVERLFVYQEEIAAFLPADRQVAGYGIGAEGKVDPVFLEVFRGVAAEIAGQVFRTVIAGIHRPYDL